MPVRKVQGGYQWGQSGRVYPTKAQAERQGRAVYASGYRGGGIIPVGFRRWASSGPRSFNTGGIVPVGRKDSTKVVEGGVPEDSGITGLLRKGWRAAMETPLYPNSPTTLGDAAPGMLQGARFIPTGVGDVAELTNLGINMRDPEYRAQLLQFAPSDRSKPWYERNITLDPGLPPGLRAPEFNLSPAQMEGLGALLPIVPAGILKSTGKASETGGVSRRAYHGTQSPRDFSLKDISTQGPVYDEATDAYFMSGSGDPTAYMGAHFSIEPETANKFAEGRGADWLRSRYAGEGDIGPRVIPVDVRGNYKKFKDDDEVWDFVFSQNSNASEIETRILKEADYVDSEADRLFARYDSDIDYRREVNRNALDDVRHHEDGGESLAADLGSSAREILSGQGFDGYEYGNLVEGGTSIAVFDSANIQSPYENLQKITGRIPALSVREGEVPNMSSISASLYNYEVLPGIRSVQIKDFETDPHKLFYAKDDIDHVNRLAQEIRESGEISPLIVVRDSEGPYILEGGHRLAALGELGVEEFPAIVVRDLD